MSEPLKMNTEGYAEYLQSIIKLDAIQRVTQVLDVELGDSQRMMENIKAMYSSISVEHPPVQSNDDDSQLQNVSNLDVDLPNILRPDMESTMDVDIDTIIASMKSYAEELKKNIVVVAEQPKPKEFVPLDIKQYATSLDQLGKRLANIKLVKKEDAGHRSPELEAKLEQLCVDVKMFNKMVETKTTISECNKNWGETQQESTALQYDSIISKLLAGINEVTYLLQKKQ